MSDARWLSAADTAKIIRKVLKREFADTKFSVTSETYAGGASVSIHWVDGPTVGQVDSHVSAFNGKGFDGMIDLAYSKDSWLMPDGSVSPAKSVGSANSGGFDSPYDLPAPSPEAELVRFGSGYIHTSRHHSPAFVRRVAAEMEAKTGWTAPAIIETESYWNRTKKVPTASFENWKSAADRDNWEEFSHSLYLTPADAPLVARFDYAFDDDDNEPETEPELPIAPERTEAEQIEVYHETLQKMADDIEANDAVDTSPLFQDTESRAYLLGYEDQYSDRKYANPYELSSQDSADYRRGNLDAAELFKPTVYGYFDDPEPEPFDVPDRGDIGQPDMPDCLKTDDPLRDQLDYEVRALATEIVKKTESVFIRRCVVRKIDALNANASLADIIQVGDDLMLMAERL